MNRQMGYSALFVAMSCKPAFAAEGSTDGTWGIAFWVFIAYCFIIIIPQALRACRFLLNQGGREAGKDPETGESSARDTAT